MPPSTNNNNNNSKSTFTTEKMVVFDNSTRSDIIDSAISNNAGNNLNRNRNEINERKRRKKRTFLMKRQKKKRSLKSKRLYLGHNSHSSIDEAMIDRKSELHGFLQCETPLKTNKSFFYSLSLDPVDVRNERIVIMSEAYAVFGALFLTGQQFVWEYAIANEFPNELFGRIFYFFNGIGMISNVFLAMIAGFLWLLSILFSDNHCSWVFGSKDVLNYLHHLLCIIFVSTSISVAMGIYNNSPYTETFFVIGLLGIILVTGMYEISFLIARQVPLEYSHMPLWFKYLILPYPLFFQKDRETIEKGAQLRAELLRNKAAKEHTLLYFDDYEGFGFNNKTTTIVPELKSLLQDAAKSINHTKLDVTPYLVRLVDDLYDTIDSLYDEDIDTLAQYMPRRLAKAVHHEILLIQKQKLDNNDENYDDDDDHDDDDDYDDNNNNNVVVEKGQVPEYEEEVEEMSFIKE